MSALHKIAAELSRLAGDAQAEGRIDDAYSLNVLARRLAEQIDMIEKGLAE